MDEAAELGTPLLVLVAGGLTGGSRDLGAARDRAQEVLGRLVPYAESAGVRLALEPLHPMYCADRCVLSTLHQALEWTAPFDPATVGVCVDTFHVWWDPDVLTAIGAVAAAGRLATYQVCDFLLPIPADALLARGMMGDGVIDFQPITRAVAAAGYTGAGRGGDLQRRRLGGRSRRRDVAHGRLVRAVRGAVALAPAPGHGSTTRTGAPSTYARMSSTAWA